MSLNCLVFPLSQIGQNLSVSLGTKLLLNPDGSVRQPRAGATQCISRHQLKTAWTSKTLEDYGLDKADDLLVGTLSLSRTGETVRVNGQLEIRPLLECARCLVHFRAPVEIDVDAFFMPSENFAPQDKGEIELSENDFVAYEYKKENVNLEELLVDSIETAIPDYQLCSETCKGLCMECGRDLNTEGECTHPR